MDQAAYLIVSFLVLCISFLLFKKASGSMALTKLNMLSYLFYIPLLSMSFVGSILVLMQLDDHYLLNKLQLESTRIYGWLAIMYTMITFPLGLLLAKKLILQSDVQEALRFYANKQIVNLLGNKEIILKSMLVAISVLGIFFMFYTFYYIGMIPLLSLLKGQADELARLRILASREFQGNVYLRNIFALQLLPLLSFVAFAYYKKTSSMLDLLWFLGTFIASLLMLSYDLQKSPMAMYISGFLFYLVWTNGTISIKKISAYLLVFLSIIVAFYVGFGNTDLKSILLSYNEGATGRVIFSQIAGTFFSIEFFNGLKDFIGFHSMSTLFEKFGYEYSERAGRIIMEVINPKGIEAGTAGVQNTLFIGEAWANFGLTGLLLSPLYVGFVIGSLFYLLLRLPKTPLFIGLYVFFSYKTALIGGFNDYVYNISYLSIFLVILAVLVISFKISQRLSHE